MELKDLGSVARLAGLALVALAIWLISSVFDGQPRAKGFDAPATEFSAARADATLGQLLGPEIPHPVSTPANEAVRDRVRAAFAALSVKTNVYRALGCTGRPKYGVFSCGTTQDILADVAPGAGKAIILMAHYDSVPAGPGAADDQSGVATILETVRALKARATATRHPIVALITDGEEAGLLGAASFLDNPSFKARVGAVVNVEARGNQGPSLLFQTSPGDGPLIDLYARSVPQYATSSLFAVIYKLLPNDTDLTPFIDQGFTSFNFAFSGNVAHYHTALDRRANISQSTLQQHGNNLLGVVNGLMQTDFASLKGGDDVYLTLFGYFLPRMPSSWALPLAALSLLALLIAAYISRGEVLGTRRSLMAVAAPVMAIAGSAAFGWLLHEEAVVISGQSNPSYAHPLFLRIALGLGVATFTILMTRIAGARILALSVWLWMAVLAVVSAAFLPGLSPYFLFPAMLASVLILAQARIAGAWTGANGMTVIFLSALLPMLIWFSFSSAGESVQGLALHPLFTVPAAVGAIMLLPLLAARPLTHRAWIVTLLIVGGAAFATAFVAGLQPVYSALAPQRLTINFVDDHVAGKSFWSVETPGLLPKTFRDVAHFSDQPERVSPISFQRSFVANAGALRFAAPTAIAQNTRQGAGRRVTLALAGSMDANRMFVIVPYGSGLTKIEIEGKSFLPEASSLNSVGTIFACLSNDCRGKSVTLVFDSMRPVNIQIGEQRYGLPPDGMRLEKVRPDTTVTSQTGDTTTIFGQMKLP